MTDDIPDLKERLAMAEQEARDNKRLFDEAVAQTKRVVAACAVEVRGWRVNNERLKAELKQQIEVTK